MSKTLNIDFFGSEETLLYGVNGFFFYIKEASGEDPFEWLKKFDTVREKVQEGQRISYSYIEDVVVILFAGINSYRDSKEKENISLERVKKWANGQPLDILTNVFTTAMLAFATGEAKAPPKNGAVGSEEHSTSTEPKPME